MNIISYAKFFL